jgi:putative DNA primase/helicase
VRLVNISEPPDEFKLNAPLLKQMTGNDPLTTRHLFKAFFEYVAKFIIFVNTNHLPVISDDTLFASGRIKVIPFAKHFDEKEQIKGLKEFFCKPENLSAVINWLLDGLRMYREEGLDEPEAVVKATEEYRKSADSAGMFIANCSEKVDNSEKLSRPDVYKAYVTWCNANGYPEAPKNKFFKALLRNYRIVREADGYQVHGIRLMVAV